MIMKDTAAKPSDQTAGCLLRASAWLKGTDKQVLSVRRGVTRREGVASGLRSASLVTPSTLGAAGIALKDRKALQSVPEWTRLFTTGCNA